MEALFTIWFKSYYLLGPTRALLWSTNGLRRGSVEKPNSAPEKELAQEWSQKIRVHLGYLSVRYNDLGYWIRIASVSTGSSSNLSPTKPYKDNAIDT